MIDLINRLTLWNSWKTPKDKDYIDFYVVNDNTIDIKVNEKLIENKEDDLVLCSLMIKCESKNIFSIFEKYIDKNDNSKLDILEINISTYNVMEFLTYYINTI